jgi:ceramide glucosyltransferase
VQEAILIVPAAGIAAHAWMLAAQRSLLARATPEFPENPPGVSILKPLKGVDPSLESNLASFFVQDYPGPYEVLLGAADPRDPALDCARRVSTAHPNTHSRVSADARTSGPNPKVDTLANLARRARFPVILVSDSNVRVPPGYLRDMVAHLHRPGVGLVTSPVLGEPGGGIGSDLEALQLNSFVMGGVAGLHRLGGICVVGKSMMLRRPDLEEMGGFGHLGRFLAEDQVCGEETVRRGKSVAVTGLPVRNVLGSFGLRGFVARHLRWARIRSRMAPLGYAGEILLHPVLLAAAAAAILRTPAALAVLALAVLARIALDAAAERAAGLRRPLARLALLAPLRDLLAGALWPLAFLGDAVTWRGNRIRIGPRTRILPADPAPAVPAAPARPAPAPLAASF